MRKIIKGILVILILMCIGYVQPVFASDQNLDDYIYNHLKNWDTEFEIPYYNDDVIDVVQNIAKQDDYLSRSISQLCYKKEENKATLIVAYRTTKEQEEYIDEELKKVINSIITPNMNDFDKVKTINKYLVDRYEYDYELQSNNVYSALTTGKTTCQGYAMSAYKMLNLAGIENRIVIGTLSGTPHGWNLVKVGGKWYQLDVTNDDAVGIDKYFLKSDDYLKKDGFSWNSSDYPKCDSNYQETLQSNKVNESANNVTSKEDYYLNNNGQRIYTYRSSVDGNWCLVNGFWYFLKNDGDYAIGWKLIDNNWYYLSDNGIMQTGWIYSDSKWYYCYPTTGAMATNTSINGDIVDTNGTWIA